MQVANKTGYDRHYELIYKVVAEYQKQNDTDEIIDFLKSQSEKIKFSGNNKTINFYILQGKLGMYIFNKTNRKCYSMEYFNNAINNLKLLGSDKWVEFQDFIDSNKIFCED